LGTLMEAMAAGRPVVAADGPATRERLVSGRDGLCYPIGEGEALATTVAALLDLPRLRAALGHGARERVRRDFDARRLTARLGQELAKVAKEHMFHGRYVRRADRASTLPTSPSSICGVGK